MMGSSGGVPCLLLGARLMKLPRYDGVEVEVESARCDLAGIMKGGDCHVRQQVDKKSMPICAVPKFFIERPITRTGFTPTPRDHLRYMVKLYDGMLASYLLQLPLPKIRLSLCSSMFFQSMNISMNKNDDSRTRCIAQSFKYIW